MLYQTHEDGMDKVIAYVSRILSSTESKYPAHKLEFLALKWSVTDRFHENLYGGKFEVCTENNPLTYVVPSGLRKTQWRHRTFNASGKEVGWL